MNKVQFDSMTFQERNGTCGMKPERSGRNLAEKSGTDRDLKWDEICSVLFCFLNWYGMFRPFRAKRNGIDNLGLITSSREFDFGLLYLNSWLVTTLYFMYFYLYKYFKLHFQDRYMKISIRVNDIEAICLSRT